MTFPVWHDVDRGLEVQRDVPVDRRVGDDVRPRGVDPRLVKVRCLCRVVLDSHLRDASRGHDEEGERVVLRPSDPEPGRIRGEGGHRIQVDPAALGVVDCHVVDGEEWHRRRCVQSRPYHHDGRVPVPHQTCSGRHQARVVQLDEGLLVVAAQRAPELARHRGEEADEAGLVVGPRGHQPRRAAPGGVSLHANLRVLGEGDDGAGLDGDGRRSLDPDARGDGVGDPVPGPGLVGGDVARVGDHGAVGGPAGGGSTDRELERLRTSWCRPCS